MTKSMELNKLRIWLIALVFLNLLDAISTIIGISAHDLTWEANPFMRNLASHTNILFAFGIFKMLIAILIALGFYKFSVWLKEEKFIKFGKAFVIVLVILYTIGVTLNFLVIT